MEQVLLNESRISPKVMFLKPLSAAISIGTGGPFGAEGPIIATGGALGSVIGQLFHITADERKTLLAAGAAAGMAATFGTPGCGRAARGRAAAVRVPAALADPGVARGRDRDGCSHRVRRRRARLPDARTSRRRAGRRWRRTSR